MRLAGTLWLLICSKIHIKKLFMYCLHIHALSKLYMHVIITYMSEICAC